MVNPTSAQAQPATAAAVEAVDTEVPERTERDEAITLYEGRKRRLDVIRAMMLVAAATGVASVFAPWWMTSIPPQRMQVNVDGRATWIELGDAVVTTTGLMGGQLTRAVIVAAAGFALWYALGRLWWFVAPAVLWITNPVIALGPPNTPPSNRVGTRSHLADLTTDMWGLTMNRVAFYTMLCLIIAAGVQAWRVKAASRAVDRAEGVPTGLWETKILPRLAQAGVSISIGDKKPNTPN